MVQVEYITPDGWMEATFGIEGHAEPGAMSLLLVALNVLPYKTILTLILH